jgi:predicted dehydrogenase
MDRTPGIDRRDFVKGTTAALFTLGARAPAERVRVAVIGVNGRGVDHVRHFSSLPNSEVAYVCDVDANVLAKGVGAAKGQAAPPKTIADFRRALDDKDVDAITVAAPDHWHAPMTLLALSAGKHVYVEKPSGHDPREDEMLIAAAAARPRQLVQLGTQRRSGPHFFEAISQLRDGLVGVPYLARTWYMNTRAGIGHGKPAPAPANLDWELWQGPAPRTAYRDNVVHYNWHWFTRWGTGEICNNGTHEMDVARWLLGVDYPASVVSSGTRWHFNDDWEFPDTQEATYEFEGRKSIVWHGQSCNGLPMYGRSRGVAVLGTGGSLVIDQDGYVFADLKNKVLRDSAKGPPLEAAGDDALTRLHMRNFVDAIRTGAKLNAPIADGAKTGMLCHLGTIAQQTGRKLKIDPKTGRILDDADAMKSWSRTYAPGWAPTV